MLNGLSKIDHVTAIAHKTNIPQKNTPNVTWEKVNLLETDEINNFASSFEGEGSRLTVIHCAALKIDGLVANFDENHWDQIVRLNLKANFLLTKAFLPLMMKNKWGRLVNVSSVAGKTGAIGSAPYCMSKSALYGMSRSIAREYARASITSNVIELGYFDVGLYRDLPQKQKKLLLDQIPSGRLGDPADIVKCIKFLIDAEYVNGAVINVDGGV